MKEKKFTILLTIVIAIAFIVYGMYNYYKPPKEQQPYTIHQERDDTLRIAYIGDSWAFMHKKHDCLIPRIIKDTLHRPVTVHSYGICGLTSKEFYESLFNNKDLKSFIKKRRYKYCIISLGINDTYKKMSTHYYQKSIEYIIYFFQKNHITPIIIEIPDYDIEKAYNNQSASKIILRKVSETITGTTVNCKQDFREALNELIHENNRLNHKINIIRYKDWNSNYHMDLTNYYLPDHMHLNSKGYALLDTCIARYIIKNL